MDVVKWKGFWTRQDAIDNPKKIFLFGDNYLDSILNYVPKSTQAVIRGLPNSVGIETKKDRHHSKYSYLSDENLQWFIHHLDFKKRKIEELIQELAATTIVLPENGIGTGKAMLEEKAPLLFEYLNNWLDKLNELKEFSNEK